MNKLKLTPKKIEVMLIGRVENLKDIVLLTFAVVQLTLTDSVKTSEIRDSIAAGETSYKTTFSYSSL